MFIYFVKIRCLVFNSAENGVNKLILRKIKENRKQEKNKIQDLCLNTVK
jgi:hypothetical protein